jgi:hypothetical protein
MTYQTRFLEIAETEWHEIMQYYDYESPGNPSIPAIAEKLRNSRDTSLSSPARFDRDIARSTPVSFRLSRCVFRDS